MCIRLRLAPLRVLLTLSSFYRTPDIVVVSHHLQHIEGCTVLLLRFGCLFTLQAMSHSPRGSCGAAAPPVDANTEMWTDMCKRPSHPVTRLHILFLCLPPLPSSS